MLMLWQNTFQQIENSRNHRRFEKFNIAFRDPKTYCKITLKLKVQIW